MITPENNSDMTHNTHTHTHTHTHTTHNVKKTNTHTSHTAHARASHLCRLGMCTRQLCIAARVTAHCFEFGDKRLGSDIKLDAVRRAPGTRLGDSLLQRADDERIVVAGGRVSSAHVGVLRRVKGDGVGGELGAGSGDFERRIGAATETGALGVDNGTLGFGLVIMHKRERERKKGRDRGKRHTDTTT